MYLSAGKQQLTFERSVQRKTAMQCERHGLFKPLNKEGDI